MVAQGRTLCGQRLSGRISARSDKESYLELFSQPGIEKKKSMVSIAEGVMGEVLKASP
jgi:hypothetical protein